MCLSDYSSEELERIQRRAVHMIFPQLTQYRQALTEVGVPILGETRETLSQKLFNDIMTDNNHKLANLLAPKTATHCTLKRNKTFNIPICRTDSYKNSFIINITFKEITKYLNCAIFLYCSLQSFFYCFLN